MKRLIVPALLALGIHGLLLAVDPHRLGWTAPARLQTRTVTVFLTPLVSPKPAPISIPAKAEPVLKKMQPLDPKLQPKLAQIDRKITTLPTAAKIPDPKKRPQPKPPEKSKSEPTEFTQTHKPRPAQIQPAQDAAEKAPVSDLPASTPPHRTAPADAAALVTDPPLVEEARPLYETNPAPEYPRAARRKGLQGTILLKVLVDDQGLVKELKILRSCGFDMLDKAALKAVKTWRFTPGTHNNQQVEMWVTVPIRFQLENS